MPRLNETNLRSSLNNFRILSEFLKERPWAYWRQWRNGKGSRDGSRAGCEDVSRLRRKKQLLEGTFRLGQRWEWGPSPLSCSVTAIAAWNCCFSFFWASRMSLPLATGLNPSMLFPSGPTKSYEGLFHFGGHKYSHLGEIGRAVGL